MVIGRIDLELGHQGKIEVLVGQVLDNDIMRMNLDVITKVAQDLWQKWNLDVALIEPWILHLWLVSSGIMLSKADSELNIDYLIDQFAGSLMDSEVRTWAHEYTVREELRNLVRKALVAARAGDDRRMFVLMQWALVGPFVETYGSLSQVSETAKREIVHEASRFLTSSLWASAPVWK